jgi:thioredoxin reductase (NADPH)
MYDIIIIGAGVAGMTAAIYARRANKKVLLLEKKTYGGQILETETIENFPSLPHIKGTELAQKIFTQVKEFNPDFKYESVESISKNDDNIFKIITDSNEYQTKSIIVATGTDYRKLGLPLEAELTGNGVSYCATCDGALFKDKTIAVFGGGNSALYSALYLSDIASKVYVIHRRDTFRGDAALVSKLEAKPNIEFIFNNVIDELKASDNKLSSLILKNTQTEEKSELEVSGLFVEIGRAPKNDFLNSLVELDNDGYIVADETGTTSTPGIFAAGDCRTKNLRQIITATSDGASAASSAIKYL